MKELLIVRHGKSEWPDGIPDFDRPLAKKGIRQTTELGEEIYRLNLVPGLVYCSPALRTKETLNRLSLQFKNQFQLVEDQALYHGDVEEYLKLIHKTHDHFQRIMIVGHNPTVSALASKLEAGNKMYQLTTSNLVYLVSEARRWKDFIEADEEWYYIP